MIGGSTLPPMSAPELHVVSGHLTGDAALDTAVSRAILLRVGEGALPETLQVGTPHRVVAFGKHDTLTDGFDDAVAIAVDHGYDPTIRIAGGRAVVFSPTVIRFTWTQQVSDPAKSMHARFRILSGAVVDALGSLGLEGTIGEIPNEYCAGEFSVHIRRRKVMGVGQRLTRSAAQVGGMIVVAGSEAINEVLSPVYRALSVPMDPTATGAVAEFDGSIDVQAMTDAFVVALGGNRARVAAGIDDETRTLAASLHQDHIPSALA